MRNIKAIFLTDLKSVLKNVFALVIAIGICILPALYAWLNIYSNWDPYENTGNLKLAAISLDKGYSDENGQYKNVGSDVIEDLKTSDNVDWQFVKSTDEAVSGVESGEYYAALIISEDFTYNMYNVFIEDVNRPQLYFYQNQKKNPVATKISDAVVEKIQTNINEEFVKVMSTEVFKDANQLSNDIDEKGGVDALIDQMKKIEDEMQDYKQTVNGIISGNAVLKTAINSAKADTNEIKDRASTGADAINAASNSLSETQDTLNIYSYQVNLAISTIQSSLNNISMRLNEAVLLGDMSSLNSTIKKTDQDVKLMQTDLDALRESLVAASTGGALTPSQAAQVATAIATIDVINTSVNEINSYVDALALGDLGDKGLNKTRNKEEELKKSIYKTQLKVSDTQAQINNNLIPQMNVCIDNLEIVLNDASTLMRQMSSTISGMGNVFSSMQTAVNAGNTSLSKTSDAIGEISNRLSKIIDKVDKAASNEKVKVLLDTLKGDPNIYGEFFSEPVLIEATEVYPVENYGSQVAPFFTVLAIWVGALILAAIVRPVPKKGKYPNMKQTEIFFGRYMMYFLLGQIQTLVIVLGDILIFKIQCLHPILFWFAAAVTSFVFTLIIYSLFIAFGDVGKAIAVVLVVIQIAGSSGTYPIELLPSFFQKVYLFFPFPYAINAMRECVGGLYQMDYVIYLLELCVFVVLALVIGIWIRKPFDKLKKYMRKRMDDTEML